MKTAIQIIIAILFFGNSAVAQKTKKKNKAAVKKEAQTIKKETSIDTKDNLTNKSTDKTTVIKENVWKTLTKITYKKKYDEIMGFKVDVPVFSDPIKKLEGKEVQLKGYIVPVEGYKSHKEFILSAFPYNMCFFCGGAGPETVMEVESTEPIEFTAQQIVLKGVLRLNEDDINRLMYALEDAILIEE